MKAQAMVEFALILPLMLVLILGVFQVGLALLTSSRLQHAAQQAAVVGAGKPADCDRALETVPIIYGSEPAEASCSQPGDVLEVVLADGAPLVGPWGPWEISVSGRAIANSHGQP